MALQFAHTWERVANQVEQGGLLTVYTDHHTVQTGNGDTVDVWFTIKQHDTARGTTYDVYYPHREGRRAIGLHGLDFETAHAVIAAYTAGMRH